jgi:hypothetical protein
LQAQTIDKMANDIVSVNEVQGEVIFYQPDNTMRIEVRLEDETVWLTQQQMAELFSTDRTSIARHIGNIYTSDELEEEATCAKIAQVRQEGNRRVKRTMVYYNLDMIISVGYRVNSKRGTMFRQWANRILKEYVLRGYAVNERIMRLEQKVLKHEEQINLVLQTALPPIQGVFYDGQLWDARALVL